MATHEEVVARWMIEAGRDTGHFLPRSDNLFVSKSEPSYVLYFDRSGRGQWAKGVPARNVPLARFIGTRYNGGFCLLNGDGLEDALATHWQAQVRTAAQAQFGWERCAIIPFAALRGGGVDASTIRIIEITQDTNLNERRIIDLPIDVRLNTPVLLASAGFHRTDGYTNDPDAVTQTWEGIYEGVRLAISIRNQIAYGSIPSNWSGDAAWDIRTVNVWAQPEFGAFAWQGLQRTGHQGTHTMRNPRTNEIISTWQWNERVHRLGSVVFSGHGPDARRHRWISAFDMQEPGGLYYLAQIPDKGDCKTYQQAIDLLAPPIVHQARENGRQVYRQGDVFAVEISWPDEQVYEQAMFRVRRDVVMQNLEEVLRGGMRPTAPAEGEVMEKGTCPFCEHIHQFGNGPKARRALMIHGTGHTADEVCVTKKGVTYIKGVMRHDPALETPGRVPEHREVQLVANSGHGWFVAVRNTVPRARAARTRPAADTAAGRRVVSREAVEALAI